VVGSEDSSHTRQHLLVALTFLSITIVQTWPLATHVSQVIPGDLGDPLLNAWLLWWNAHAVPLTQRWQDAPMFFPTRGTMAFSETLLGLSIVASPMQWAGATPIVAYNLLFLLSFPLSALAAYWLAWTLTRRPGPSIIAGIIYGYAISRFGHLGHIQILWSWWMPVALLGLHRWFAERRASGLWLFAIAWLGESLSNGYYFFYFSVIVSLWIAWFTPWRQLREARRVLLPVLIAWVAAVVCMAPVLLMYSRVQQQYHFGRAFEEIAGPRNGADLTDFFTPSPIARFTGMMAPEHARHEDRAEREVSIGIIGTLALIASIVVALRNRQEGQGDRSLLAFYTIATLAAMVLAMGPLPRAFGVGLLPSGPYAWLMTIVPGINGVRVPARFTLLAMLCLAIATALMLARVRLNRVALSAIALLALLDTWPKPIEQPTLPPLVDRHVLTPQAVAVLELPTGGFQEYTALYRAMFHGHPVVNGTSGYTPASYFDLMICLEARNRDHVHCLTPVRRAGPIDVLIDRQHDGSSETEQFIAQVPDAQFRFQNRQFTVFHLPALPAAATH
jgi:hypothetical protein